jgi:hypothetical protein
MLKNIAIFGDEGRQLTQALLRVTGRSACSRLASGGVSCPSGVCEELNSSCIGTRVTDYSSGGGLKVSPNPFSGNAENNPGS